MKKLLIFLAISIVALVGCKENEVMNQNSIVAEESNQVEKVTEVAENDIASRVTEYVDVTGRNIVLEEKPKRVIALYASFGDLWYQAGGSLVGVVDGADLLEFDDTVASVGKMSTANIEVILGLEPDLVIIREGYATQEELLKILETTNTPVYIADYNSLEEMTKVYKDFTDMNDASTLYEENIVPIIASVEDMKTNKSDFDYLLMFATSKSISTKDDNATAKIINDLGGKNITETYQVADESTKQFSFEKILEINPKYIFVQTMGDIEKAKERLQEDVTSNPAWQNLDAVKNNRFIYLPKDLFLYKPNLRYLEAYEYIKTILEP